MANPRQEGKSTQSVHDTVRRTTERTAEQTSRIGKNVAEAGEEMARAGANLLQQNAEKTAEQTSRIGQTVAEAGEKVARAGANLLQQNAETLQNTWRFGLDMATTVMGRSTDQLGRTLGEAQQATERSARSAETILYSTTAVTKGMSGMSQEYFEFVRHQIENSIHRMNELSRCRTPQDVAVVQSNLVRDTVESVLESSRRMADMSLKLADDTAKHMTQNMEQMQRAA